MAKAQGNRSRPKPGATTEAVRPPARGAQPHADRPAGDGPIRVRVKSGMMGYYDDKRRREGDVFSIPNERLFSERWMERVDPRTPEKITTGAEDLRRKHDELLAGAAVSGQGASAGLKPAEDDGENPLA